MTFSSKVSDCLTIREMSLNDCWIGTMCSADAKSYASWSLSSYEGMLAGLRTRGYVAEFEGVPAGVVMFSVMESTATIRIHQIAVSPPFRRRGVGKSLAYSVLGLMREGFSAKCTVPEDDLRAHLFLSRIGFVAVSRGGRYLTQGHIEFVAAYHEEMDFVSWKNGCRANE